MTPIGNAPLPSGKPRRSPLSFLLATGAVMLWQSAYAQVTASGGQTVRITPAQATCKNEICFHAIDPGSLLYSNADTPIDVTVPPALNGDDYDIGIFAEDGATINLKGGGIVRVGGGSTGLQANWGDVAGATIYATDLSLDVADVARGAIASRSSRMTFSGQTTLVGHGAWSDGLSAQSGSTITVNGPINASGAWLYIANSSDGSRVDLKGGGTISLTGAGQGVFSAAADGVLTATGMTIHADTNQSSGTSLLSAGSSSTIRISHSELDGANSGGTISAIHVSNAVTENATVVLDDSKLTMNSAGAAIYADGGRATVRLTGSDVTAFKGSGGLLANVGTGRIFHLPSALSLSVIDSTLSGDMAVEAPAADGPNTLSASLRGTTTWTGNLTVNGTSRGSVTLADSAHWIGSASNATTVVLSSAAALWAIPGGGNSTVTGTVRNAGKIAFQAGGPTTLTVRNFVNDGGTIQVNINAAGQNDFIHATGTATINGGTVSVIPATGTYTIGQTYKILTANGGITGQFSKVVDNAPFVDLGLSQNANNIYLKVTRNDVAFDTVAASQSQHAVADSVETLASGNALYQAVAKAPDIASARQAFATLSGDVHASARSVLVQDSGLIRDAVLNRLYSADLDAIIPAAMLPGPTAYAGNMPAAAPAPFGSATPTALSGLWAKGFGSWGHLGGGGRDARIDHDTGGFLIGFDTLVQGSFLQDWRLGALAGYSHSSFDVDARAASGTADNYHVGLYAGRQWNALALRLGATYTWHDIDSDRAVALPGFADRLSTSYDAGTAQLFGELGYRIDSQAFRLEPFINAAYLNLHTDGFRETGGDAALTGRGDTSNLGFTTLGLRAATSFDLTEGTSATLQATLGWRHAFGDVRPTAALALANGSAFTASGTPIARDAVVVDTGISVALSHAASLGVSYSGQFGEKAIDQSVRGNFVWKF
ncbi:autotransporter domain-containing protein [Labrys sp. LIt4]|uniref:autotransporter outer membrane beta-barrel domain-containing protein n=1 Tax=Labrys sp. LIt4 TaxID=2821355 RepID=UPI001AE0DD7F|nr:autotransporter domain-containing protein [Labrys sp. LIt4]MBP0581280.1 autotransporter domain-containing protein [Labrys sp. LIt4]